MAIHRVHIFGGAGSGKTTLAREIAEKLGITEATSKSQLSKARAKLKIWMNQEENRHEQKIY